MEEAKREFIDPDDWRSVRKDILSKKGRICEKCGKECFRQPIHLQQKDYNYEFGGENQESLMLVCDECHKELHQDLEFFDNIETVGVCPKCRKPMITKGNKFVCNRCGLEFEPKIK